ncbi:hypothetical protein [Paenibacillus bouchesdurhonensis]|uniref:hypothetical protein n=1 Tax=Paenibacillus bouchesdurhonensis TaxID=1870990 RepID=UPI000DA610FF|nr:hypothetical protein [Paenibacillus bouchesdurhonensis]
MCTHGTTRLVKLKKRRSVSGSLSVPVDDCIADEIQSLNDNGVITLGCCCGHGQAGKIIEWTNEVGKWKGYESPPHALVDQKSIEKCKELGYRPFPYYYADGSQNGVWQIQLKTGCLTPEDVVMWELGGRQ